MSAWSCKPTTKGKAVFFHSIPWCAGGKRWLMYPAMIGGSAVLSEGMITPPITVSSAVEGLQGMESLAHFHIPVVQVTIAIISVLFAFQQFGTAAVGKFFGPVMLVWFSMLGVLGVLYR